LKKLELESGQNPIEAAILGCKIYHGPYVKNFNEIYEYLNILKISKKIRNEDELFEELIEDLKKPKEVNINNLNIIEQYGRKILENTTYELLKISKL
jgi:3-deoxy-D-manno-octulosonic-acid transferase